MATMISATLVNELRQRSGSGIMECKKALELTGGDVERAVEELRKSGRARADKKAGRTAAEGAIVIFEKANKAVIMEANSETDFVARDENFITFAKAGIETLIDSTVESVEELSALPLHGYEPRTVEECRLELVSKVGENVQIRRFARSSSLETATIGTYLHGNRIGVIVELDTDNKDLARDIAMHIAASKPLVISPDSVPADVVAKEKEIYLAQAAASGKSPEIIEKMVAGRVKKYLDEVSLVGQPFVKDPDMTVGGLLSKHRAKVLAFYRFEVGEGIEKTVEDFKETVMSQVQGG
jgi:elongation factor Ts